MHEWQDRHAAKVGAIARVLRERATGAGPVHIDKGGVHHVVPLPGDPRFDRGRVDVSTLNEVLEIDAERRLCVAEPGVTFADLVRATLAQGLIPTTVPELEGITVGGAVAGCSVEAMSYRYGGFHDGAVEYEVVTGNGEVLTCSPEQEPDLFHMIHGSYGTLGILTRLTFRLVPAKPFVRMEYLRYPAAEPFFAAMRAHCEAGDADYIDGIIHAPDCHILCLGRFTDEAPYRSDYRWLNIFYKSTRERTDDYLATADYCFRYDTECHWLTRTFPPLEWKPVRLLAGKPFLGSTKLIRWSKRLERAFAFKKRPDVVCDVFIPARRFLEFHAWYADTFNYFPLWIVPYRIAETYPWVSDAHAARMDDSLFIDCAVYGKPNGEPDRDYSALLEEKTYELGGIKTLISRNHHTPERFWQVYSKPRYEAAKRRLDPSGAFANLYEKFHRAR